LQIKQSVAFGVLQPDPDDDFSVTILACRVTILACRVTILACRVTILAYRMKLTARVVPLKKFSLQGPSLTTILACRVIILACRTKLIHFKNLITHFLSIQFGRYGVRRLVGQQQRYQILKQARHFAIFGFRVLELHVSAIHLVVLLTNE
jgi:hypothetical protein